MEEKKKPTQRFKGGLQSQKAGHEHYLLQQVFLISLKKAKEKLLAMFCRGKHRSLITKVLWAKTRGGHSLYAYICIFFVCVHIYIYLNILHLRTSFQNPYFFLTICITKYSKEGFILERQKLASAT